MLNAHEYIKQLDRLEKGKAEATVTRARNKLLSDRINLIAEMRSLEQRIQTLMRERVAV